MIAPKKNIGYLALILLLPLVFIALFVIKKIQEISDQSPKEVINNLLLWIPITTYALVIIYNLSRYYLCEGVNFILHGGKPLLPVTKKTMRTFLLSLLIIIAFIVSPLLSAMYSIPTGTLLWNIFGDHQIPALVELGYAISISLVMTLVFWLLMFAGISFTNSSLR